MKSKIYLKEIVENKDRKFGSLLEYYPARVETEDGKVFNALFTENDINEAMLRAESNPEDIPKTGFLESIFG
jgi:hypothetical protein